MVMEIKVNQYIKAETCYGMSLPFTVSSFKEIRLYQCGSAWGGKETLYLFI